MLSGDISGIAAQYLDHEVSRYPGACQQQLATKVTIGKRMPHGILVKHADGRTVSTHFVLPSNEQAICENAQLAKDARSMRTTQGRELTSPRLYWSWMLQQRYFASLHRPCMSKARYELTRSARSLPPVGRRARLGL